MSKPASRRHKAATALRIHRHLHASKYFALALRLEIAKQSLCLFFHKLRCDILSLTRRGPDCLSKIVGAIGLPFLLARCQTTCAFEAVADRLALERDLFKMKKACNSACNFGPLSWGMGFQN